MGEYAHAMGNGLGNFDQFWALARKYPQVQGGFIWDWADQNLRQPLVLTPDSSRNRIESFLVGKPGQEAGHRGKALALSGLDDFVNVFRDPRLDVAGSALTLDAWVKPGTWHGSFPIVTKGQQYGLQMRDQQTLEFAVDTGDRHTVTAAVPADWYGAWHRVTGVYDGGALRLYVDGAQVATTELTGALQSGLFELNVGRNAETQQDNYSGGHFARGLVDDVRVYGTALTPGQLTSGADPAGTAVLALNFDQYTPRGDVPQPGAEPVGHRRPGRLRPVSPAGDGGAGRRADTGAVHRGRRGPGSVLRPQRAAGRHAGVVPALVAGGGRPLAAVGTPAAAARAGPNCRAGPRRRPGQSPGRRALVQPGRLHHPCAALGTQGLAVRARAVRRGRPGRARGSARARRAPRRRFSASTPRGSAGPVPRSSSPAAAGRIASTPPRGRSPRWAPRGQELLRTGPQLDVYRPPTSNETYDWGTDDRAIWHDLGLDRLRTTVSGVTTKTEADGTVVVEVRSYAAGPGTAELASFDQVMRYRIDARGTITLDHQVQPKGSRIRSLPYLPRLGFFVQVPKSMQRFAWYGRGPEESYNDRKAGTPVGVWKSTVEKEYVRYSRPQAYGNHTDTRWATISDGGRGLLVAGDLDVSVTPYDQLDRAEYDFQLPLVRNADWVTLHVEHGETGMGETPNSVLAPFRVRPDRDYEYSVTLRPLTAPELRAGGVLDSRGPGLCPPDLTVETDGQVTPGTAERVEVAVTPRCAAGLQNVGVTLAAPQGWTVTPASVDLGDVAQASPEKAAFLVNAPAGEDIGSFPLDATVAFSSPPGLRGTARASATVRTPLPPGSRWVSDLPFVSQQNGWGPAERDRSNGEQGAADGRPLSIGGTAFGKGLGVHAASAIEVALPERCTTFTADVGLDDETGGGGSVAFEVWVDGVRKAATGVLRGGGGPVRVSADVTGGQSLRLSVTDGGDGNGQDHGDWGGARIACQG